MHKININNKYNVYIGNNIEKIKENYTKKYRRVFNIFDSNLNLNLKNSLAVDTQKKDWNNIEKIIIFFNNNLVKRNSDLILVTGGGTLTDLVGFAVSIYKRGIDFALIPTTLLAMVDASIGSKNGIDFANQKNLLGTFNDPKFVIVDTLYLNTLSNREINSAMAEIIKISYLKNNDITFKENIEDLIYKAIVLKKHFILNDYKDISIRNYLNFGHTFGHAIESYFDFKKYTHGEAISIGMMLAYPNYELYLILKKNNLPYILREKINFEKIYELMLNDKKNDTDKIKIISLINKHTPTFKYINNVLDLKDYFKEVNKLVNTWEKEIT